MVGLLTEIIGNPTPMDIPVVPDRLIPSSANPYPVLPQKWHFRQSIDYSVALNYGVLMYAMRHKDELLYNIYKMGRNSIERGEKDTWTLSPKRSAEINKIYQASQQTATAGRRPASDAAPAPDENFGNRNVIPKKVYDSVFKNTTYRDPRGYIIPADQADFATATRFINTMLTSGMIVQKATAAFTVAR